MSGSLETKAACFFPPDRLCPASCPGLKASRFIGEYIVEVCPNPAIVGSQPNIIDPGDDGPTVVTVYRVEAPTLDELTKAVVEASLRG